MDLFGLRSPVTKRVERGQCVSVLLAKSLLTELKASFHQCKSLPVTSL
jgi:hypothetical protein